MHKASCFSMFPDVPNLWKVHFVILKWIHWLHYTQGEKKEKSHSIMMTLSLIQKVLIQCKSLKWNKYIISFFYNMIYMTSSINIWIPWEDIYHWVYPVFLISVSKWHHFNTVSEKCSIKKSIQQEHLTWRVKKIRWLNFRNHRACRLVCIKFEGVQTQRNYYQKICCFKS